MPASNRRSILRHKPRAAIGLRKAFIAATLLSAFSAYGVDYVTSDDFPLFNVGYGSEDTLELTAEDTVTLQLDQQVHSVNVGRTDPGTSQPGIGTLTISGASILIDETARLANYGSINIGRGAGSQGTVHHHSGTVTVNNGAFQIGVTSGIGEYNLNGGSISFAKGSTVYIGEDTGGQGTLTIDNDASFIHGVTGDVVTGAFEIGSSGGTGAIVQKGSDSVVSLVGGPIRFGNGAGSSGSYALSAGDLTMWGSVGVTLGETAGSTGEFTQTGGTSSFLYSSDGHPTLRVGKGGSGTFTVSGGTATVGKSILLADTAGSSGTLNVTDTGVLEIGGANAISKGAGNAAFNMGGGTLRVIDKDLSTSVDISLTSGTSSKVDTNGHNASLSGAISGDGDLVKEGLGDLILEEENSYTGTTDVTAGRLIVASGATTGQGAVTIGTDGTLSGTGTVQGEATIQGALNPGNSPGNLTFEQGLTLENTAVTTLEIAGYTPGEYSTLTITSGDLQLGGTLALEITSIFDVGEYDFSFFDVTSGSILEDFDTILLTGLYSGSFVNQGDGLWTLAYGDNSFLFDATAGTLEAVVAIPEPGTIALLLGTAAGLLAFRRRRSAA